MRCSEPGQRALVAIHPFAGRVAELGSLAVMQLHFKEWSGAPAFLSAGVFI